MKYKVKHLFADHLIGKDLWLSKQHLADSFFGDFYEFIYSHNGKEDLKKHNISNRKQFVQFALDWFAEGMENCYAVGFAFHDYYLTVDSGGTIENQPKDTYIGYCFHNDKYKDFLNFLITFFAWWRNDEGCTCFVPYNHADDFFNSNWAVLVDTAKLFYFTAETVFFWQSFRVKYALDNIPGTILSIFEEEREYNEGEALVPVRVAGYEFKGYFDEKGNEVFNVNKNMSVYAKLVRKDFYNYWEKEEKTIHKEYDPNYKKVDPA